MKKLFAIIITCALIVFPVVGVFAEEEIEETTIEEVTTIEEETTIEESAAEAAAEDTVPVETEVATTCEEVAEVSEEVTTIEDDETESSTLTIEEIRATMISIIAGASEDEILKIQENVGIALDKVVDLTGWDYLREFCDRYMTQISWIIFGIAVIIAGYKVVKSIKKNTDVSTKASNNAVEIAEQTKTTADTVAQYALIITEAKAMIEELIKKYDELKEEDQKKLDEISAIKEEESKKEQNQADALITLASILNDMLQLSSLPDAQKDAIYTKFQTIKNQIEGK